MLTLCRAKRTKRTQQSLASSPAARDTGLDPGKILGTLAPARRSMVGKAGRMPEEIMAGLVVALAKVTDETKDSAGGGRGCSAVTSKINERPRTCHLDSPNQTGCCNKSRLRSTRDGCRSLLVSSSCHRPTAAHISLLTIAVTRRCSRCPWETSLFSQRPMRNVTILHTIPPPLLPLTTNRRWRHRRRQTAHRSRSQDSSTPIDLRRRRRRLRARSYSCSVICVVRWDMARLPWCALRSYETRRERWKY